MSAFCLKVEEVKAYGRVIYKPACVNSKLIISWMKNREAFTQKEIKEAENAGWLVIVVEPMKEEKHV